MLNIIIPLGGKSLFYEDSAYHFSKYLIDINGKPMIQLVLEPFLKINEEKRFIFVVKQEDCDKYHLENILKLLTNENCIIIKLNRDTLGAVCSCLMAIKHINKSTELIISNGDIIIDKDYNLILSSFRERQLDSGVVIFESLHPQWSYVRLDDKNNIVETAEKKTISRHAITGFYYFKDGSEFVKASMKSIEKETNVNGYYYVALVINELVLLNKKLGVYKIDNSQYHSFYTPSKIMEYEKKHNN